jgi:hypothetical protein
MDIKELPLIDTSEDGDWLEDSPAVQLDNLISEQLAQQHTEKGGAGSGFFGHAGRPGKKGGSASQGIAQAAFSKPASPPIDYLTSDFLQKNSHYLLSLNGDDVDAIRHYTGAACYEINAGLRGKRELTNTASHYAKALDHALENAPALDGDTIVYRGTQDKSAEDLGLKPGTLFLDKGFCSTTVNFVVAESRTSNKGSCLFKIVLPKGQKILYVEPLSASVGEKEIILPRNMHFRVKSVTKELTHEKLYRPYEYDVVELEAVS